MTVSSSASPVLAMRWSLMCLPHPQSCTQGQPLTWMAGVYASQHPEYFDTFFTESRRNAEYVGSSLVTSRPVWRLNRKVAQHIDVNREAAFPLRRA